MDLPSLFGVLLHPHLAQDFHCGVLAGAARPVRRPQPPQQLRPIRPDRLGQRGPFLAGGGHR